MSEKLKYKVGDKVLVEAEVIRADNSYGNPYQIQFDDGRTFALNRGMLEDNKTELYSLGTLVKFFADSGFEPVIPILLGGVYENEVQEELKVEEV